MHGYEIISSFGNLDTKRSFILAEINPAEDTHIANMVDKVASGKLCWTLRINFGVYYSPMTMIFRWQLLGLYTLNADSPWICILTRMI